MSFRTEQCRKGFARALTLAACFCSASLAGGRNEPPFAEKLGATAHYWVNSATVGVATGSVVMVNTDGSFALDTGVFMDRELLFTDRYYLTLEETTLVLDAGGITFPANSLVDISVSPGPMTPIAASPPKSCSVSCGSGTYACCQSKGILTTSAKCECKPTSNTTAVCDSGGQGATACSITVTEAPVLEIIEGPQPVEVDGLTLDAIFAPADFAPLEEGARPH